MSRPVAIAIALLGVRVCSFGNGWLIVQIPGWVPVSVRDVALSEICARTTRADRWVTAEAYGPFVSFRVRAR